MKHLIDKDAVVAEIEKRKAINEKSYVRAFLNSNDNRDSFGYKVEEDIDILSSIDTLEVKEVDLDKIIDSFFQRYKNGDNELLICDKTDFSLIAKHFFELGIAVSNKAQKGE